MTFTAGLEQEFAFFQKNNKGKSVQFAAQSACGFITWQHNFVELRKMQKTNFVVSPSAANIEKAFLYGAAVAASLAFSLAEDDFELFLWSVLGIYLGEINSIDSEVESLLRARDAHKNVVQVGAKLMASYLVNGREDKYCYQLANLVEIYDPGNAIHVDPVERMSTGENGEKEGEPIDYDLSPSGYRFPEITMEQHRECEKLCEYWVRIIGWNVDPEVKGCEFLATDTTQKLLTPEDAKRYDDDMATLLSVCGSTDGAKAYVDDAIQRSIRMAAAAPYLDAIRGAATSDKMQIKKSGVFSAILRRFGF